MWLFVILFVATVLRIYHVTYHDTYTDEAIYAFRSIGLIDYDTSPSQTTPWQWFGAVPWWAHLSWHDHPLGFFLLQYFAFALFGAGLFAMRLPSVLAGIGSVYLIYLIGRKLWNERAGLIAALLLAVQPYHVWVSRVGLQDGFVIFLLLLALWFLLHVKEKPQYWLWLGAATGLSLFTKYTTLIIFPIIALYLFIASHKLSSRPSRGEWRDLGDNPDSLRQAQGRLSTSLRYARNDKNVPLSLWREKYFWYGIVLFFLFFSPVWLYNIMLYRATGHFDFQISAALGQDVPAWAFRMGRSQVGGLFDRFINFFRALWYTNSPVFNIATALSLITLSSMGIRRKNKTILFVLGSTFIMYLWFFIIGSTYRFVVMIIPLFVLIIAYALQHNANNANLMPIPACRQAGTNIRRIDINSLIGIIIFLELLFSINSFLLSRSMGWQNFTYAKLNEETQNYGFNQLNDYLEQTLRGKVSALFGQPEYQFLTDLQTKNIAKLKDGGATPTALIIIYDNDINFTAGLWSFQRLITYYGWPVLSDEKFFSYTGDKYDAYYREQGISQFIYIAPASDTVLKPAIDRKEKKHAFENYLEEKKITPEIIHNARGEVAFLVYRF